MSNWRLGFGRRWCGEWVLFILAESRRGGRKHRNSGKKQSCNLRSHACSYQNMENIAKPTAIKTTPHPTIPPRSAYG
jgi:hypothetical protein